MSDFRHSARCPGCGQRFAPDDGMCCSPCIYCQKPGKWRFCDACDGCHCDSDHCLEHCTDRPAEDDS